MCLMFESVTESALKCHFEEAAQNEKVMNLFSSGCVDLHLRIGDHLDA